MAEAILYLFIHYVPYFQQQLVISFIEYLYSNLCNLFI